MRAARYNVHLAGGQLFHLTPGSRVLDAASSSPSTRMNAAARQANGATSSMSVDRTIESLTKTIEHVRLLVDELNWGVKQTITRLNRTLDIFEREVQHVGADVDFTAKQITDTVAQLPRAWLYYLVFSSIALCLTAASLLLVANMASRVNDMWRSRRDNRYRHSPDGYYSSEASERAKSAQCSPCANCLPRSDSYRTANQYSNNQADYGYAPKETMANGDYRAGVYYPQEPRRYGNRRWQRADNAAYNGGNARPLMAQAADVGRMPV